MRLKVIALCAAVLCASAAKAQDYVLSLNDSTVVAGDTVNITLWVMNNSQEPITLPSELSATLRQNNPFKLSPVSLSWGEASRTELAPGAFKKLSLQFDAPRDLTEGVAELSLTEASASILFSVSSENDAEAIQDSQALPVAASSDGNGVLDGVSPYKPIYFLFGTGPFDAKFQISLKYQLFNPNGRWAEKQHWLTHWYLGYTQTAFWDLAAKSKPFEDTNFMPELFYRVEGWRPDFLPKNGALDLQAGFMHESNGKGGDDSRSLNILYGRATYKHMIDEDWFFRLTGDIWRYVGSLKDNPDIDMYRGHSSLGLTVGAEHGIQFSSYRRGRIGGSKGSYLFDLSVPVKRINAEKNFNFKLHGQLFTGYGENLLTYNQKETRFRLGLGIYR